MQFAIDHQGLSLQTHLQVRLLDIDSQLLGCGAFGDDYVDGHLAEGLLPGVLVSRPAIS